MGPEKLWNVFDFLIVLLSVLDPGLVGLFLGMRGLRLQGGDAEYRRLVARVFFFFLGGGGWCFILVVLCVCACCPPRP